MNKKKKSPVQLLPFLQIYTVVLFLVLHNIQFMNLCILCYHTYYECHFFGTFKQYNSLETILYCGMLMSWYAAALPIESGL